MLLAVGVAQRQAPNQGLLPDGATRTVSLPFTQGIDGEVALVVGQELANALEATAPDELLTTTRTVRRR